MKKLRKYPRSAQLFAAVVTALVVAAGAAPAASAGSTQTPVITNPMTTWTSLTTGVSLQVVDSPVPALRVATTAAGPLDVWLASAGSPDARAVAQAGTVYTAGASILAETTARLAVSYLVFYDASGSKLAGVAGQAVSDSTAAWTTLPAVTGVAPAATASMMSGVVVYGTAAGELNDVAQPVTTSRAGASSAVHGPLHTLGNTIVDADGHPVVLRGVNRIGMETDASKWPRDAEIAQAKSWGANVVRVPLSESLWLNTCKAILPSNDPGYQAKVDYVVNSITSRGMVAIVDLHFSVLRTCGRPGLQSMADAQYSVEFWRQVASRYMSNPLVAFELYNEPRDITDSVWLNGGTTTYAGVTYQAAGMQTLYDTVRAQGATNLILAGGNDTATRPPATLINGVDIAYVVHVYTCGTEPPPGCTTLQPYDPSPILSKWTTFAASHAVMATEFGWPDASNGIYNANTVAALEARGISWTAFAWDGGTNGLFSLLSSMGTAFEPSPAGIAVLQGFARNA